MARKHSLITASEARYGRADAGQGVNLRAAADMIGAAYDFAPLPPQTGGEPGVTTVYMALTGGGERVVVKALTSCTTTGGGYYYGWEVVEGLADCPDPNNLNHPADAYWMAVRARVENNRAARLAGKGR